MDGQECPTHIPEVMVGHDSTYQPRSQVDAAGFVSDGWLRHWQRTWSQVACGAGLAIGCFLLWRRVEGGLHRPLSWQALIAVGLSLVATAAVIRHFWAEDDSRRLLSGRRWLPALMLLSIGLAVSLAGTNGIALIAMWGLLLVTESLWLFRTESATDLNDSTAVAVDELSPSPPLGDDRKDDDEFQTNTRFAESADLASVDTLTPTVEEELPEQEEGEVLQRLLRTRDVNGQEVLFGELRADFAVGDRQSRLHVAFCPPLERPPQVYAEATSIDEGLGEVAVKVAQVLVLGTRIDVELEAPAEAAGAVKVEFYAAVES